MKSFVFAGIYASAAFALPQAQQPALPPGMANVPKGLGSIVVPNGPAPKGCNQYEVIVARGTSEPGPFGVIVGDPLVAGVTKLVPTARGYAVQYPASGDANSAPTGATDLVNRLTSQSQACPDQKFALVGYSQGARVIRLAAPKVDKALYPKIVAIVTFGDPGQKNPNGTPERPAVDLPAEWKAKLKMNCAKGDPACDKDSKNDFAPHLTYNNKGTTWQADSAAFIAAAFQGQSLPKVNNDPAKH